ncbi:hypothetical protein [Streptomyces alkaliterrae]|uniref:Uncharacterized protein n=1 Tax=Streptomyces alkaliterrae TaxID=2213162 RepID=A0A5P0YYP1_9ACTN|nr:hypothetical protein [Streptomyces alkaliterrae]MBB1259089.1 hypothetical protein [Streptomyces alkaliterrae]MQS04657.1 hypothetical protein [Streptomyces alkaliterrae]
MNAAPEPCGRRRPRWLETPPLVASRLPCALPAGHDGPHEDAIGQQWVWLPPELVDAVAVLCTVDRVRQAFATADTPAEEAER